ncbi:MAG: radical SAM protein [Candidatus Peribacteraceae bacterium]|nr:radical SAM protein [Candidatus Peribacteraceae bacterium]
MITPAETEKRNALKLSKPYVYEKILKYKEKTEKCESIAIIQLQYDYRCNFHCNHCSIEKFRHSTSLHLTIPDIKNLSKQADNLGLAHFVITGGEPLMFPDLDELVAAIDPQKFYISCDTNGWHLNAARAHHLKSIGIDKIQLSIDNFDPETHDVFRNKPGSHARAMAAVENAIDANLALIIQTVVTKQRLYTTEFQKFLSYFTAKNVPVFVTYAKPVGAWEGKFDILVNKDDMEYMRYLESKYNVFTHLTPSYELDLGCIAVKRMISITEQGHVLPCPYLHVSLGNILDEPLSTIIYRGLSIKYFEKHVSTCLVAEDRNFIKKYVTKTYGKPLPILHTEMFEPEDYIPCIQQDPKQTKNV